MSSTKCLFVFQVNTSRAIPSAPEDSEWEEEEGDISMSSVKNSPSCPPWKAIRPKPGKSMKRVSTFKGKKKTVRASSKHSVESGSRHNVENQLPQSFLARSSASTSPHRPEGSLSGPLAESTLKGQEANRRREEAVKLKQEECKRMNEEKAKKAQEKREEAERQRLLKLTEQQKHDEANERQRLENEAKKQERTNQNRQKMLDAEARRQEEKERLRKEAMERLNFSPLSSSSETKSSGMKPQSTSFILPSASKQSVKPTGSQKIAPSSNSKSDPPKTPGNILKDSSVNGKPKAFRQLANPDKVFTPLPPVDINGIQAAKRHMQQFSSSKSHPSVSHTNSATLPSIPTLESLNTAFLISDGLKIPPTANRTSGSVNREKPPPAKTSIQTLPAQISTQPLPAKTSIQPLPTQTSTQTLPAQTSTQPLPAKITTQTLLTQTSTQPLSAQTSVQTLPSKSSVQTLSAQTSTQPLSANTSVQTLPTKTSVQTLSAQTNTQPLSAQTSTQPLLAQTSTQPLSAPTSVQTLPTKSSIQTLPAKSSVPQSSNANSLNPGSTASAPVVQAPIATFSSAFSNTLSSNVVKMPKLISLKKPDEATPESTRPPVAKIATAPAPKPQVTAAAPKQYKSSSYQSGVTYPSHKVAIPKKPTGEYVDYGLDVQEDDDTVRF